ncbi:MAG: VWA domain-containing protein [Acidimicrobiales bacterium]
MRVTALKALAAGALLALVVAVGGGVGGAQPPPVGPGGDPDGQVQILGVGQDADTISLDVAVPATFGPRRTAGDFAVTDGDDLVDDLTVAALGTPAATVLALDVSGSMEGAALDAARAAARRFAQTVSADTRVGLVTFGSDVVIRQEPTLDRARLLAALDGITTAGGDTSLWDGLVTAADLVGADDGRSSVVVLSDGGDTVSTADRALAVEHLTAHRTILYAVAVESPEADLPALQATVDQVGGQVLAAADIGEFESIYSEIAGRLANRYQLTYISSQQGTRTVVVSVAVDGAVATASVTLQGRGATAPPGGGTGDPAPAPGAPLVTAPPPAVTTVGGGGRWAGSLLFWIGNGSVFGALTLLGLLIARSSPQVQLATVTSADRVAGINAQLGQVVDRLVSRHDSQRRLDARLDAAGIDLRPGELVLVSLAATAATLVLAVALAGPVLAVLVMPIPPLVVMLVLNIRAGRRRSRFADQLTATLAIMANSLRAGQSLRQAIELVATEAPSPSAELFHRIHFEVRVGRDLTESMRDVARRMDSADMEWLAQAVDIHRELGGDLTEILNNLAATLRERRSVARQVNALSAEGRATGWVLLAMPIVLFLFSWWRTPDNIGRMLTDPLGRILLVLAVSGMTLGHLWIRQLVKVKY